MSHAAAPVEVRPTVLETGSSQRPQVSTTSITTFTRGYNDGFACPSRLSVTLVRHACPQRRLSDSRPPTTQRQAWRAPGTLGSVARGSCAPLQPSSCRLTRSSPKCPESERRIGYRFDPRHPQSRRCHIRRPRATNRHTSPRLEYATGANNVENVSSRKDEVLAAGAPT